jgi:hypothetical protein
LRLLRAFDAPSAPYRGWLGEPTATTSFTRQVAAEFVTRKDAQQPSQGGHGWGLPGVSHWLITHTNTHTHTHTHIHTHTHTHTHIYTHIGSPILAERRQSLFSDSYGEAAEIEQKRLQEDLNSGLPIPEPNGRWDRPGTSTGVRKVRLSPSRNSSSPRASIGTGTGTGTGTGSGTGTGTGTGTSTGTRSRTKSKYKDDTSGNASGIHYVPYLFRIPIATLQHRDRYSATPPEQHSRINE